MIDKRILFTLATFALSPTAAFGEVLGEAPRLGDERIHQTQIINGELSLTQIRRAGLKIFTTPFNRLDGFGDGLSGPYETCNQISNRDHHNGCRPTLQGNGTFLRINGLDAQTCLECHSIVSNATVPATFGIGGFGGINSSPLFQPSLLNVGDEWQGVFDGIAEIDGRLINPPFLFGAGGIELVAKEMTRELQYLKEQAMDNPGSEIALVSKGVYFGTIVYNSYNSGDLDTSKVEGIDPDLVVKPFGRKGEFPTLRAFDTEAMMFHLGMQPVEVVGEGNDADRDEVANEILIGELSALGIFVATMDRPVEQQRSAQIQEGFRIFERIGCADCHKPAMETQSRFLNFSQPEEPEDPDANVFYSVDLSRKPADFERNRQNGITVPMFSDLKRHDMGPALAESFSLATQQQNREFITARLWGVADSAPYLHDGRALTLFEAIDLHGIDLQGGEAQDVGEAQAARDSFRALDDTDKNALLHFLGSLRTPRNPNADVLK